MSYLIDINKASIMGWASYHIEKLKLGETIKFRPKGNSMQPKIESGQLVTVEPVLNPGILQVGDVVLCSIGGNQYLHLITAIRGEQFQISNNKGWINGWCTAKQIYGKCTAVEP